MTSKTRLPHDSVVTRLRPSKVHKGGVGVFAISKRKKGTPLFFDDTGKIFWVRKSRLKGLSRELKKLYRDFPIIKNNGEVYGCPKSFNLLTVAWYLNHSKKDPNVICNSKYNFFAKRNISIGEELTVDYDTYNEF
jgi:SET domain